MPILHSDYEVETFSGQFVDVANPDPQTIKLQDVAHALSQTCRYGGHCTSFYSVAEHAVFVSIRIARRGGSKFEQIAALHHDDAEAYLGDVPRPMKPLLGDAYGQMTERMDEAILIGLDLPLAPDDLHTAAIKDADNWALFVEARHLLPSQGKGWWDGEQGSWRWDINDLPSRIITPDYWKDGLSPRQSAKLYIERHNDLLRKDTT